MRFAFLGGTSLDGGRFFGLPNAATGLILGSAVYVAASLRPRIGYAVIVATALVVGLPWTGSDIGGAVALFAGAGIWIALRLEGPGWRRVIVAVGTVVVGTGVVLAAHRFLVSAPTHGTRFVETAAANPGDVWTTLWDRWGIGLALLRRSPSGLLYLAGMPILMWCVIRPRGVLREIFERLPQWRTAMLAILWASVVAFAVNDTGVSAVGFGFAMALGGTLYVPLADEPGKIEAV
jgi:hypothetical protein